MKVFVEVYDSCKYERDSKKVGEARYDIEEFEVRQISDEEIYSMGFDEVDPYGEYLILTLAGGETSTFRNSFCDKYIRMTGGWWELREADEPYNDFNRSIIAYMKKACGSLYLGNINFNDDDQRKRICAGEESVYEEYTGQQIYNFHCTFAVPVKDEALEELIRRWNRGAEPHNSGVVDQIMARVDELGGEHFLWY